MSKQMSLKALFLLWSCESLQVLLQFKMHIHQINPLVFTILLRLPVNHTVYCFGNYVKVECLLSHLMILLFIY